MEACSCPASQPRLCYATPPRGQTVSGCGEAYFLLQTMHLTDAAALMCSAARRPNASDGRRRSRVSTAHAAQLPARKRTFNEANVSLSLCARRRCSRCSLSRPAHCQPTAFKSGEESSLEAEETEALTVSGVAFQCQALAHPP